MIGGDDDDDGAAADHAIDYDACHLCESAVSWWRRSKSTSLNRSRSNPRMEHCSRSRLWNSKRHFDQRFLLYIINQWPRMLCWVV